MGHQSSRRRFLVALGGSLGVLTGCQEQSPDETPTSRSEAVAGSTPDSIRGVDVETSDLVVDLVEGHDVSTLTLVGPDGELVTDQTVSPGVLTVRLPILDIEAGLGGYEHYTPGTQELVVSTSDDQERMDIQLEPDLRITNVAQYGGDSPAALANLSVTIENTGSGPTWIYDIAYEGAPNRAANNELVDNPGSPILSQPSDPESTIIEPNAKQVFTGTSPPLLIPEEQESPCSNQNLEFAIKIGSPVEEVLRQNIEVTVHGDRKLQSTTGHFACTAVDIEADGDSA